MLDLLAYFSVFGGGIFDCGFAALGTPRLSMVKTIMALDITIDYLANHAELADELAQISWNEWQSVYKERGQIFAHALRNYRERVNVDSIPLALVAFADGKLIGTASLKNDDL